MKSGRTLQLIGGLKILKGSLLLLVAAGLLSVLHKDQATTISKIVHQLSVDPNAKYFRMFADKFLRLSPKLPLVTIGGFLYGALFLVEGIGLMKRKRWAEYLTVIATASFLPLEFYEMVKHASPTKGLVIALNLAILVYLVGQLLKKHRQSHHSREAVASKGKIAS